MPTDPLESTPPIEESPLDLGDGRPPLSKPAIFAGLIGLLFLIPWPPLLAFWKGGTKATQLGTVLGMIGAAIAIILGILSIFHTRKGRHRGRWLGITACVLGLLGIATQLATGGLTYILASSVKCANQSVVVLKASAADRSTKAAEWREKFASKRFEVSASPNEFEEWLEEVSKKHGQLQQIELDKSGPVRSVNSATVVRLKGHFVNGMTPVEVEIGFDDGDAKVDDIRVGKSSPLD
jgi:hypothetical protein